MHEQSRPDRDKYVTINYSNIQGGNAHNFDICNNCQFQQTPYDYNSIMHYGRWDFSKFWPFLTTISVKNGEQIGQRNGFSTWDIYGINRLYCSQRE